MSVLIIERDENLKTLCLNRPEHANALNAELVDAITQEIELSGRDGTRTLILRGNGKSFCSGFDFSQIEKLSDAELADRIVNIERMLQALYHAPFVTLALIHSMAFGLGADLVCCCHRRVSTPGCRYQFPGRNFGILLGTRRLSHRVGTDNAIGILTSNRIFEAPEALEMGFLTDIAPVRQWPDQIESAQSASNTITSEQIQQMLAAVVPDIRATDMTELIAAVSVSGLVDRVLEFRDKIQTNMGKRTRW